MPRGAARPGAMVAGRCAVEYRSAADLRRATSANDRFSDLLHGAVASGSGRVAGLYVAGVCPLSDAGWRRIGNVRMLGVSQRARWRGKTARVSLGAGIRAGRAFQPVSKSLAGEGGQASPPIVDARVLFPGPPYLWRKRWRAPQQRSRVDYRQERLSRYSRRPPGGCAKTDPKPIAAGSSRAAALAPKRNYSGHCA